MQIVLKQTLSESTRFGKDCRRATKMFWRCFILNAHHHHHGRPVGYYHCGVFFLFVFYRFSTAQLSTGLVWHVSLQLTHSQHLKTALCISALNQFFECIFYDYPPYLKQYLITVQPTTRIILFSLFQESTQKSCDLHFNLKPRQTGTVCPDPFLLLPF